MKEILKLIIVAILTWEAKLVLKKYKPKIIAVTGSVGKTSTKDTIHAVLSHFFYVRKSEKSFNSELGVPLTILKCPTGWSSPLQWLKNIYEGLALIMLPNDYPKILVLEIGADRPGDIQKITEWIKPDIAVITQLSKVPVHVEFFRSPEEVMREKRFLAEAVHRDGVVILNGDDEDVRAFAGEVEAKSIFYGTENADILGTQYSIVYDEKKPAGVSFVVTVNDKSEEVVLKGGLGMQHVYPALAALAVGAARGLDLKKMITALEKHEPTAGRMRVLSGVKDSTIIDDTYNSSPVALHEALNTLKIVKAHRGRKIVVLGDMLELGMYSIDEHKKAGTHVAKVASILITVGVRSHGIAEGALNAGMKEDSIFQYDDSREAGKQLELLLQKNDIALVKGSQGVRMERTVEEVLADPTKKEKLLVRQEIEWQGR